jgi:hypothetical protein
MFEQLIQGFTQSPQGQNAMQQLQGQGYSPQQSANILATGLPVAAQSMQQGMANGAIPPPAAGGAPPGQLGITNIGGSHYGMNFLAGAVTGLLRGEGVMGSAVDGVQAVVGGHVAEVIASRFGFSRSVAGVVGAIVTPLMIDYLWDAFRGGGMPGFGAAPAGGGFGSAFAPGPMGAMGAMGAFAGQQPGYPSAFAPGQMPMQGYPMQGYPQQGGWYGGPPQFQPPMGAYPQPDYNAQAKYAEAKKEAMYEQQQYADKQYYAQQEYVAQQQGQIGYDPGWGGGYGKQYDPGYDPGYVDPGVYDDYDKKKW